MITNAELAMVLAAVAHKALPGVNTPVGDPVASNQLKSYHTLSTNAHAPIFYDAVHNRVIIQANGAVLDGYDLRGTNVVVMANNVTIKDSTFDTASGYYAVNQVYGASGMTVEDCSFNGHANTNNGYAAFITGGNGQATIVNNSFIDAPSDAIHVENGTVSGNYIEGGGYGSNLHPDAVYVGTSTGPVDISNNFIDWTNNSDAVTGTNNAVRITAEQGPTSNVDVHDNVLIGGSFTVTPGGTNSIYTNNYIGFGQYGAFYPTMASGTTIAGNHIVDFTNRAFSDQAWQAYSTTGIHTDHLMIEPSGGGVNLIGAASGSTTLYGGGTLEHLFGTANTTVFIGGYGTQYFWGGSGKNIYTFLSIADSTTIHPKAIGNFDVSKDVIDLSHINADITTSGMHAFHFIGSNAFSAAGGEVRVVQDAAHDMTYVEADLVGDTSADLFIPLQGLLNLTAANFVGTTVTEVRASMGSGFYHAGQTIALTVDMNNAVTVAGGTPTLSLNDGGTATYDAAHSISTALVFDYTVGTGQSTSALGVTSVNLNGASVVDGEGNSAGFSLAGLQTTFSGVGIDTTTPQVTPVRAHDSHLHETISTTAATGALAHDSNAVSADHLSVSSVNGAAGNVGHAVAGSYGSLTLYADGHYSYVDASVPSQGVGEDVFQFTVANQAGTVVPTSLTVLVTQPNQTFIAGTPGQTVTGTLGAVVDGALGNQHLYAGGGAAALIGGSNDTLTGAGGPDTFVFGPTNFGKNTITNFDASKDVIQFDHTEFANYTALQSHAQQVASNTVITLDPADTVTLTGVHLSSLHASDFHFV